MTTYLVLWTQPEDVDGFEREYNEDHIPLAQRLPGLRRFFAARVREGRFHRVAELEFDSIESLKEAFSASEEGKHLFENSRHLQDTYEVSVERLILDD